MLSLSFNDIKSILNTQIVKPMLQPIFGKPVDIEIYNSDSYMEVNFKLDLINIFWKENGQKLNITLNTSWYPQDDEDEKRYNKSAEEYMRKLKHLGTPIRSANNTKTKNDRDDGFSVDIKFTIDPYAKLGKYKNFLDL